MAYSEPLTCSLRKGQSALLCQICENEPKLECKCIDCGLMMCKICYDKVHLTFPALDHTVINIKDLGKSHEKHNFTQMNCDLHVGQNCCLFCKTCKNLVCPVCIAKIHKKHNLIEIHEAFTMRTDKVKNIQKKNMDGFDLLSERETELRTLKFLEDSHYNKTKRGILNREMTLMEAVKNRAQKLLDDLDQQQNFVFNSIHEEERKIEQFKEAILQQNDEVNDLMQSFNPKRMFSEDFQSLNIKPNNTKINHIPQFVPGEDNYTRVPSLFGTLAEKKNSRYNKNLKVIDAIKTEFQTVDNLIACPDDFLWINNCHLKFVQKVHIEKNTLRVISSIKIMVKYMTITQSGDLLLSVDGSSVIKILPSGTEELKDSPYDVSPLLPIGINVTHDNKVIIGARASGPAFPTVGPRQVIVLDQSGQQEKIFQYDQHNKPLFTIPCRVTCSSNNNIGVIDMLSSDWQGRVIILNNEGEVINIYTGNSDIHTFKPVNIVITLSDNFVTVDRDNHTLHILSSNGDIITCYTTI